MVNVEVLKTPQGFLKIIHVILGVIAIGIIGDKVVEIRAFPAVIANEVFVFMLVSFAFLVTSFLLLVSVILDESADNLGKSIFEIIYHLFGFIFYFSASVAVFALLGKSPPEAKRGKFYAAWIIGTLCGLLNSVAYGANAFVGFKLRRG